MLEELLGKPIANLQADEMASIFKWDTKTKFTTYPHKVLEEIKRGHATYWGLSGFMRFFTIRLDGKTRLSLIEPQETGDLLAPPISHLGALFRNDVRRLQLRSLTAEAFGLHLVIDPTPITHLRVRMSQRPPSSNAEEQALDNAAREFHRAAADIDSLSDGVKAFSGLLAAVLSGEYGIVLIDEPEAFLHPPLARLLGKRLTEIAATVGSTIVTATHSAEFLMGCVRAGTNVNILRLTHSRGVATARSLPPGDLETMMRDPLLRSTGVLNALFHEGAVVAEADSDRVIYQEINERLLSAGEGIKNSLFLNAQNKQTVARIVQPLRQMGVAAAAVIDLDILKEAAPLKELLKACSVPQEVIDSWGSLRGNLCRKFESVGKDPKRCGVEGLDKPSQQSLTDFISWLKTYGIFVVPVGELENWLGTLSVTGKAPQWVVKVFEKMGSDPLAADYLKPTEGDVWDFLRDIAFWINDPLRQGIPA
jgi:hypothetical protein